jgi:hypothetical protein
MTTFATADLVAQHHRELAAEAAHRRTVKSVRSSAVRSHAPARAPRTFRTWLEAGWL